MNLRLLNRPTIIKFRYQASTFFLDKSTNEVFWFMNSEKQSCGFFSKREINNLFKNKVWIKI